MQTKMQFTNAQKAAITEEREPLLVSAAAGSGKTAVLCERILQKLLDPKNPGSITKMLIVTFTKAAAGELKTRLSGKLREAISRDMGNRHLRKQLAALPSAQICTIHSFCLDLLRRNFQELSLPASLRVADTGESEALQARVMEECVEKLYEEADGERKQRLDRLQDSLVDTREDLFAPRLVSVYKRLSAEIEGTALLAPASENLQKEAAMLSSGGAFFQSSFGKKLRDAYLEKLRYFRRQYDLALTVLSGSETVKRAYGDAFFWDLEYLTRVISALENGDDAVSDLLLAVPKPKLGSLKKEYQDDEVLFCKSLRNALYAFYEKGGSYGIGVPPETLAVQFSAFSELLSTLALIETAFDRALEKEKQRLGIIDFADIERYSLRLLADETGAPTPLARELSTRYEEVCIDEYQDVNAIQDCIFRMLAPKHRFMVGDIKQSIYGFRGARPEIFSDYRDRFLAKEACGESIPEEDFPGMKLFLSDNFRCDGEIISFSNALFRVLFGVGRSMKYLPEDDLQRGKSDSEDLHIPVELWLCEKPSRKKKKDEEIPECPVSEADMTAARVQKLLREGVSKKEIVILVRSLQNCGEELSAAFEKRGIALDAGYEESFQRRPEVLLLLSLLHAIDNPLRDIYLVSAMKSPLFGFSLRELTQIRGLCPKGHFYMAVKAAAEEQETVSRECREKCVAFLDFLEKYRRLDASLSPDRLFLQLLSEYSLLPMLSAGLEESGAEDCRASVMKLYDFARSYTEGGKSGLGGFLSRMEKLFQSGVREKGRAIPDAVRVMTVHNAKGLEFPVCILYGCGKLFPTKKESFLYDRALGPMLLLRDKSGYAKLDSPLRTAVKYALEDAGLEEEMRVLYVALTRAKNRLILTGSTEAPRQLLKTLSIESRALCRSSFSDGGHRCYLHWILLCMSLAQNRECCKIGGREEISALLEETEALPQTAEQTPKAAESLETPVSAQPETARCAGFEKALAEKLDFSYPYKTEAALPAKLSVSRLWPSVLDEGEEEGKDLLRSVRFREPLFLTGGMEDKSAAARGTATHTFMQFCNFENVLQTGVEKELERLIQAGYLTAGMGELVNLSHVRKFFASSLFSQMRRARLLRREQRFNILFPAAAFTGKEEKREAISKNKLLVQGVIDCFFESENGELFLVDYKTDFFTKSEMESGAAEQEMLCRHQNQMSYYAAALEKIFGRRPDVCALWAFSLGKELRFPEDMLFRREMRNQPL